MPATSVTSAAIARLYSWRFGPDIPVLLEYTKCRQLSAIGDRKPGGI